MNDKLMTMRHSAAHVLAAAVEHLFPEAKFGVGPVIDEGFYYDILLPNPLSDEDLKKIEKEMRKIIAADFPMERSEMLIAEAIKFFEERRQTFKVELLKELEEYGTTDLSQQGEKTDVEKPGVAVMYTTGDFVDLCRGPHVGSTKEIGAWKLSKISGAYWRGNEKNPQMQRIYSLCFETQQELEAYEAMLEEAKRRDHRKLGKELDLFHIDEMVGLGLPLWHPRGAQLWRTIEDFWYRAHQKNGYELVRTPHIGNRTLWETSGHWGFYSASMYPPIEIGQTLEEKKQNIKAEKSEEYLLKPMNCPFHVRIYQNDMRSYRDFPFRWAECGTVYRYEKSGELNGLVRVRGFTQDDAHIICRKDEVREELKRVVDFILYIYRSFGFAEKDVHVYLSLRDPKNTKKYSGNDEGWKFTEDVLREVAKEKKLDFKEEIGEAAFYGPKLDFKVRDCLGREWQCSTLQFDFNLPERFNMTYINADGKEEQPYMLHRALFGSFERFIGLLIEHYAGAFPMWLAPEQIRIATVSADYIEAAQHLMDELVGHGLRVALDKSDEKVGKKIRNAALMKTPWTIVIGKKEAEGGAYQINVFGQEENLMIEQSEILAKALEASQSPK
ncbi:MAG: threonine--tRNA ligase [Patescibacteria group bacterium]|jgi:threonyl-tRNA synthetase